MGMAASQARYLSLTARKSNVEYEGQQVNQQRTALSNESANLYNKLANLDVPTVPSVTDYYETTYTFTTGDLEDSGSTTGSTEYSFTGLYNYLGQSYVELSYTDYQWQSQVSKSYSGSIAKTTTSGSETYEVTPINGEKTDAEKYEYKTSSVDLTFDEKCISTSDSGDNSDGVTESDNSSSSVTIGSLTGELSGDTLTIGGVDYKVTDNGNGTYSVTLNVDPTSKLISGTDVNYGDIEYGEDEKGNVLYKTTSLSGDYYNSEDEILAAAGYLDSSFLKSDAGENQPILVYYIDGTPYYISAQDTYEVDNSATGSDDFSSSVYLANVASQATVSYPCSVTTASSGRYSSITVTDDDGIEHTYSLEVSSVQDTEAYEQAMLDYEYEQALYDKQVSDINAKTEEIQQQDKVLELRLKQLDTEQDALSTEMDSISKVIEDNIEATFKTFA